MPKIKEGGGMTSACVLFVFTLVGIVLGQLGCHARASGSAKLPPRGDEILIELKSNRVRVGDQAFYAVGLGREEWIEGVGALSLGLSNPQSRPKIYPQVDDGLPVDCDMPETLLRSLVDKYAESEHKCTGQVDASPMGPFAFVECPLPNREGSIACSTYYRAFVWGEIDASVPALTRIDGAKVTKRFAFTVRSLSFLSSTCDRDGLNQYESDIDQADRRRLQGTGTTMELFFRRCAVAPKAALADEGVQ